MCCNTLVELCLAGLRFEGFNMPVQLEDKSKGGGRQGKHFRCDFTICFAAK